MNDHFTVCPTCHQLVGAPRCDVCNDSGYVSEVWAADGAGGISYTRCPKGCLGPQLVNAATITLHPTGSRRAA